MDFYDTNYSKHFTLREQKENVSSCTLNHTCTQTVTNIQNNIILLLSIYTFLTDTVKEEIQLLILLTHFFKYVRYFKNVIYIYIYNLAIN